MRDRVTVVQHDARRRVRSRSYAGSIDVRPASLQIGMFCPLDLFRLKELTCPVTINNLAVASTKCHLGAGTESTGKHEGGKRSFINLCDLVIFNEAPYLT